jgi:hypothetical protein
MAGKNVTFNVRVSVETAQAIDQARAGQSRSAWVADAIDAALSAGEDPPVELRSKSQQRRVAAESGKCPHPRARVIKGFCYACGMPTAV